MKYRYFKSIIDYDVYLDQCKNIFYICEKYENNRHTRVILTEDGNIPTLSGEDSYWDALAAVFRIHSELGKHYCVKTVSMKWKELPENIQKIFNYEKFRKEHPLKLNKIDSNKVYRYPVPAWVKDIKRWLECGSQPFDHVISESGFIGINDSQCPVCGSRKVRHEEYNNLCPQHLAGSAGYVETCEDCGYSHRTITIMS